MLRLSVRNSREIGRQRGLQTPNEDHLEAVQPLAVTVVGL